MFLRMLGLLILAAAILGTVVAVLGLKAAPESVRKLSVASLFTSIGVVALGFGLAFSSGLSRIVLVAAGITSYLYGLALGYVNKRKDTEP